VKRLIILIPFTVDTPNIARGGALIDQLEVLLKTFQKSPSRMTESLVPIVTKVKPTDTQFDFDQFKMQVEEIMSANLENYLITLRNENQVADIT
jgi:hypothetical protein